MVTTSPDRHTSTRLRTLSAALHGQAVSALHQEPNHRFDVVENPPASWPRQDLLGLREGDVLPEAVAILFAEAHDRCRATGAEEVIDFEMGEGLKRHYFEARLQPDETGVIAIVIDKTDLRARELAVASLLREVSHRSKNLLAIVQSVAMQTAHHSGDIKDFLDKFRGRLHALSSTQDLVTESDWRGTYLHSLVASQLTRVTPAGLANVHVTGANPLLGPNASLHIGLAIHELGANAVLHGALSNGQAGEVLLDARLRSAPNQPTDLVIDWKETGSSATGPRHEARFGTLVLERIVPLSVGGSADFSIDGDGVHYRLVVPGDQFEA